MPIVGPTSPAAINATNRRAWAKDSLISKSDMGGGVTEKIVEYEGKRYRVLYKKSWSKDYVSVDGGFSWVQTAARKVAFEQTPRDRWIEAS